MGENKKIIFVTARLPYPATSGRKNVMYNYCRILHERFGYDVYVASFLEEGDKVEPRPDFIKDVLVLKNINAKKKIKNLVFKTFLFKKYPMQVSLFYDEKTKQIIDNYINSINPNFVIADMVRTTEYLRNYNGYKIADLDDLISIRYERQFKQDMKDINPYGAYLYTLPNFMQKVLSTKVFKKYILKNEIELLKKYEREISKYYDKIVLVSDRESTILNEDLNFDKAIGIPLGVDVDFFKKYYKKIEVKENTIAFLGAMSVAHNEAGVIHFINNILPIVKKSKKDVKFIIVGGGVTQKVKDMVEKDTNIILTGRVDDIRKYVSECSVFVCPLTFGSGIKTKNLEAMAMGVPVVTTSIGAENINAIANKDWLIADSNEDFANAIVKVLNDKALHDQLAESAFTFVKNNFTWKVAEERMFDILPKED